MKSTSNLGPGGSNRRASSYQQQAPQLMSGRGLNLGTTTSGGGGGGVVSPSTAAGPSVSASAAAAAASGGGDGLNMEQDMERASLHERKQAIDHLKSVTGKFKSFYRDILLLLLFLLLLLLPPQVKLSFHFFLLLLLFLLLL